MVELFHELCLHLTTLLHAHTSVSLPFFSLCFLPYVRACLSTQSIMKLYIPLFFLGHAAVFSHCLNTSAFAVQFFSICCQDYRRQPYEIILFTNMLRLNTGILLSAYYFLPILLWEPLKIVLYNCLFCHCFHVFSWILLRLLLLF